METNITKASIDLHIHEDALPGNILKSSVEYFINLIESFSDDFGGSEKWLFSIKPGSAMVSAFMDDEVEEDERFALVSDIQDALIDIKHGTESKSISERTMKNLRALSSAINSPGTNFKTTIDIAPGGGLPKNIIDITDLIEKNKFTPNKVIISSFGSTAGTVKGVHGVKEKYLDLYEDFTNKRIKVLFTRIEDIDLIRSLYMKRIQATGIYTFDNSGTKKIDASRIVVLPQREDIPKMTDLIGIMEG